MKVTAPSLKELEQALDSIDAQPALSALELRYRRVDVARSPRRPP